MAERFSEVCPSKRRGRKFCHCYARSTANLWNNGCLRGFGRKPVA